MTVAVYRYRVTDKPGWLTMIADATECSLDEARRCLALKFGARLLAVECGIEAQPPGRMEGEG